MWSSMPRDLLGSLVWNLQLKPMTFVCETAWKKPFQQRSVINTGLLLILFDPVMEKLCILSTDKSTFLNKRSELITKCRHENKFYAANQKRDRFTHPPWVSLNLIPTDVYGTVWWSLRAWNSSNCVLLQFLSWISISLCMYLHRVLLRSCETFYILVCLIHDFKYFRQLQSTWECQDCQKYFAWILATS